MSIYVSIASLYDPELEFTVNDIFKYADNPQEVYVGIAMTAINDDVLENMKVFYAYTQDRLKDNNNITFKFLQGEENHKIGIGRNAAASMYSGQDYFLQIDAHTLVQKGWDTQLINLYKDALLESGNEKTILTSYLGIYWHSIDGRIPSNGFTRYPHQWEGNRVSAYDIGNGTEEKKTNFPWMQDTCIIMEHENLKDTRFFPCSKFNAQFAFGDKHFAKNRGLSNDTIFWEEEITQSIELFDLGFSMVFPNTKLKLMHLYNDSFKIPNSIVNREDPYRKTLDNVNEMCNNYQRYIDNPDNAQKIKKWEEYSGLSVYAKETSELSIPKSYR
jgi:hypothetical protein